MHKRNGKKSMPMSPSFDPKLNHVRSSLVLGVFVSARERCCSLDMLMPALLDRVTLAWWRAAPRHARATLFVLLRDFGVLEFRRGLFLLSFLRSGALVWNIMLRASSPPEGISPTHLLCSILLVVNLCVHTCRP